MTIESDLTRRAREDCPTCHTPGVVCWDHDCRCDEGDDMGTAHPDCPQHGESDLTKRAREVLAGHFPDPERTAMERLGRALQERGIVCSLSTANRLHRRGLVEKHDRRGVGGSTKGNLRSVTCTPLGREVARLIAEGA